MTICIAYMIILHNNNLLFLNYLDIIASQFVYSDDLLEVYFHLVLSRLFKLALQVLLFSPWKVVSQEAVTKNILLIK